MRAGDVTQKEGKRRYMYEATATDAKVQVFQTHGIAAVGAIKTGEPDCA